MAKKGDRTAASKLADEREQGCVEKLKVGAIS